MTLFRHLGWLVLALFLLTQLGSASLFIWHSQTILAKSLTEQAQSSAELLLNAITSRDLASTSKSQIRQLTNPLFETGTFKSVAILKNDQVIYSQELPLLVNGIPAWFETRFGIDARPIHVAKVKNQQTWQVAVEMNQAHATYRLFTIISNTLAWLIFGLIASGIALFYALKRTLRPLADLEALAQAISQHQFDFEISMPRSREFSKLALAMNMMSKKLNQMFKEQLEALHKARKLAYEDTLTGLPNSAAFENYIKLISGDQTTSRSGFMVLAKITSLTEANERMGRQQVDLCIRQLGGLWEKTWSRLNPEAYNARRNGSEFITWVEFDANGLSETNSDKHSLQSTVQSIESAFQQLQSESPAWRMLDFHISTQFVNLHQVGDSWTSAFSALEKNMQHAIETDHFAIGTGPINSSAHSYLENRKPIPAPSPTKPVRSEQEWDTILTRAIAEKSIILEFQPIAGLASASSQYGSGDVAECFMTLVQDADRISSSQLWPIINRHQLSYAFDKLLISMTLTLLAENPKQVLSINLCDTTLENTNFLPWLEARLQPSAHLVDRLYLEIKESFLKKPDAMATILKLSGLGFILILDQVIAFETTLNQFMRLPIYAIKLNIHYLRRNYHNQLLPPQSASEFQASKTADNQQQIFLQHLIALCRSCDVAIIALGVQNQRDVDLASNINAGAVQGDFICSPLQSCAACQKWSEEKQSWLPQYFR